MDTVLSGKAFVLGDDIDTDQIIPAEHLAYNPADPEERKFFGIYALSGVPPAGSGLPDGHLRFVEEGKSTSEYTIVVAGRNFGCGSSREHAPLGIAEAGAKVVIAEFYARIFYRNCVNGGYLLPCECTKRLVGEIRTGNRLEVDLEAACVTNLDTGQSFELRSLAAVKPIIEAGGVFEYARQSGILKA